jgi:beta-galactosidase
VISRYNDIGELKLPKPIKKTAYGMVQMSWQANLFTNLDRLAEPILSTCSLPMEKFGQNYGFIVYSTVISGPRPVETLHIQDVRDRALVFLDNEFIGVVERGCNHEPIAVSVPKEGARLSILVENMGRVNYGPYLKDHKGITEGVRLGFQFLFDWTIHTLPLEDLSPLVFEEITKQQGPAFYKGMLSVDHAADTFIDMEGWTKGVVFINGFNLGRYWEKGPQKTLYVPAPLLRQGSNEIVIFELHGNRNASVVFTDTSIVG